MIGDRNAKFASGSGESRADVVDDLSLLIDLQRLECDRCGDRMAGIGVAMAEAQVLAVLSRMRLVEFCVEEQPPLSAVAGGERLARVMMSGLMPEGLGTPTIAGTAEAGDDLVGNEKHVVFP